jgi:hypothetical protein
MYSKNRVTRITQAVVFVTTLAVFAGPLAGSVSAKDQTEIQLTLTLDRRGDIIVKVNPTEAKIWRKKPDKPKKVYWWTVNTTPFDDLFWELRYDPSKGGGTANYFGDVDIECGVPNIKVQPDKTPDFPNAEWPYAVSVYACVDGEKAQKLGTVDPRIVWRD